MTLDLRIEKLRRDHVLEGFDCGKEPLNRFLIRYALPNQQANASQTYLAIAADPDRITGPSWHACDEALRAGTGGT